MRCLIWCTGHTKHNLSLCQHELQMPQVPLPEHNDMVETFPADGADQALCIAVPGRTW